MVRARGPQCPLPKSLPAADLAPEESVLTPQALLSVWYRIQGKAFSATYSTPSILLMSADPPSGPLHGPLSARSTHRLLFG